MTKTVVLINPPPERIVEEYDAPPYGHMGLAYLASSLAASGIDCRVIDSKLERLKPVQVLEEVRRISPAIVGITSFTHEIMNASALAAAIKRELPGVKIVVGGVHASSLPIDTMNGFPSFDFLIRCEGERSFPDLCRAIFDGKDNNFPEIRGLYYRKDGKVQAGLESDWIKDLDSLPFPAWSLFKGMKVFAVISSRGCPFGCVFCARMLGDRVRARSPENVIAELERLVNDFGAEWVYFYDETFGFYKEWLDKFLSLMHSTGLSKKLRWGIMIRANMITEDLLTGLKDAGRRKIDFGVESGDERVLKVINKGEKKEDFVRAFLRSRAARIESHSYFILGHPTETLETATNTIDFAAKLNTDRISIGIMIPYPGTKVAEMAERGEGGYKRVSLEWTDYNKQLGNALELEGLSKRDLTRLQLLGYLKFYVKNFKVIPFFEALFRYNRLIFAIIFKDMTTRKGR